MPESAPEGVDPVIFRSAAGSPSFQAKHDRGADGRNVLAEALAPGRLRCLCRISSADGRRRERRRRICIALPQQGHRNASRGFSGIDWRGAILSTRCSSVISPSVRVQEAVVPGSPKALGRDVLQDQAQEVRTG